MPRGLPASIIKQYGITKKAWSVFFGRRRLAHQRIGVHKRYKRGNPDNPVRMARRRHYRRGNPGPRRKKSFTLPIATIAGFIAGLTSPPGSSVVDHVMKGEPEAALSRFVRNYTGYGDGRFDINELKNGIGPLIIGVAVSWLVGGRMGVNRRLGKAGVPIVRL